MTEAIEGGLLGDIAKTYADGDLTFTEDSHHAIMQQRLKTDKGKGWSKWLRNMFHKSEPFNPKVLTREEYIKLGIECEQESLKLLESTEWKKEKAGPQPGDLVEAMQHPTYGKIYRLTGVVDISAEKLFKDMTDRLENIPQWSNTTTYIKIIKDIGDDTIFVYQIASGGPKNVIKQRDFVSLCRKSRVGNKLMSSSKSVELPDNPPLEQYVRAQNNLGVWSSQPHMEDGVEKALFQWVMACDLKGWLPLYVIDIALSTAQLDFLQHLRDHAATLKVQGES